MYFNRLVMVHNAKPAAQIRKCPREWIRNEFVMREKEAVLTPILATGRLDAGHARKNKPNPSRRAQLVKACVGFKDQENQLNTNPKP